MSGFTLTRPIGRFLLKNGSSLRNGSGTGTGLRLSPSPTASTGRFISTLNRRPNLISSSSTSHQIHLSLKSKSIFQSYSTSPSQDQVFQSFTSPFSQFLQTLSRIARILLYSSLSVASLIFISFEGFHQYLEHSLIQNPSLPSSSSSDDYGFLLEHSSIPTPSSWTGKPGSSGTDKRLSIKLRHAIRSAWVCVNLGSGINPNSYLNTNGGWLGPGRVDNLGSLRKFRGASGNAGEEEGLKYAENYLIFSVRKAEEMGIKLMDLMEIQELRSNSNGQMRTIQIDPTAMALELQLASVRERLGSESSVEKSLIGYERVFELERFNQEVESSKNSYGKEPRSVEEEKTKSDSKSSLVKLATKIGTLNSELDRKAEAESWLLKAVELCGDGIGELSSMTTFSKEALKLKGNQVLPEAKSHKSSSWLPWSSSPNPNPNSKSTSTDSLIQQTQSSIVSTTSASTSTTLSTPTPTPLLTRSLIEALLALSALYASTDVTSKESLQKAIKIQADGLRICELEKKRLLKPTETKDELSKELHSIWLDHHKSVLELHLAQTFYGISKISGEGSLLKGLFSNQNSNSSPREIESKGLSMGKGIGMVKSDYLSNPLLNSKEYLQSSMDVSRKVKDQLLNTVKTSKEKRESSATLPEKWESSEKGIQIIAKRLLRDSGRVEKMSEDLLHWLKKKEGI